MTAVLAIDQRATLVTAVVVDSAGEVVARSQRQVGLRQRPGGLVDQDPRRLLGAVVQAGRSAMATVREPVDAVGLALDGDSVLAWDPTTGRPLSNVVVHPDRRADEIRSGLRDHEHMIRARTGRQLDADSPALKLAWLRRHLTTEGVATTTDSWLLQQLTGEFVTEAGAAGRSRLADLDTLGWDPELLGLFELADEPHPTILPSDRVVGTTIAFGGTHLVGGLTSSHTAAMIGAGCVRPGEALCRLGTGAELIANAGLSAARSTAGLSSSLAWWVRNRPTYCVDGQVDTATAALHWMQQLGFIDSVADLDRVASPDAGGVVAVPALTGLGAPWWRSDATAHVSGMTRFTTTGHVVVAILQGVAAQVAALGSATGADLGRPLTRIRAGGGLTRSATLMQALADVVQLDIEIDSTRHATALGAAALARIAVDPTLDVLHAITASRPTTTFTPRWSADQAHDFRGRWAKAAEVG